MNAKKLMDGANQAIERQVQARVLRALEATGVCPEARMFALACAVVTMEEHGDPVEAGAFDRYLELVRSGHREYGAVMHKLGEA